MREPRKKERASVLSLGARALILARMRGAELDSAARHKDEHSNLTISFETIRFVSMLVIRITSNNTRYSKTSECFRRKFLKFSKSCKS